MSAVPRRRLSELGKIRSGGTPLRSRPEFWEPATVPWVTTSEVDGARIASTAQSISRLGLEKSSAKIFPAGTVLIAMYGQGQTRGRSAILETAAATNQACAALEPGPAFNSEFVFQALAHSYADIRAMSNAGGQDNLSAQLVGSFQIPFPPLPEQHKIAEILRTWDDAIDATTRARALANTRYVATANSLAGAGDHGTALREGTLELTARNTALEFNRSSVMGVSNKLGIVPMREQTIAADLSRYQVLPPRAFAYNPMRIDVGSIAMSRLGHDVIVSPDYVLFECNDDVLLAEYLDHIINTRRWRHDVSAGASGSVRTRTYYDDLAAIRVHLPEVEVQRRIVGVLDTMRDELALLDRKIELLRTQKRGLMQKLLSGDIRVPLDDGGATDA